MTLKRWLGGLALLVAFGLAAPFPARGATKPGPPVEIPVILSTTGYLAFLGKEGQHALSLLERVVNDQQDGIHGRPVKFVVEDDQSSPQVGIQLAGKIIADGRSPIIIGPLTTGGCGGILPLLKTGPVLYCLSPAFEPPSNSFGFVADPSAADDAVVALRYFRLRGWTRIAFLMIADAAGQSFDRAFAAALTRPENKDIQVVAYEHFSGADLSVVAQLAKIRSANAQALITWETGTPFGTVLRNIHDVGLELPIAAGTGNMTYAQMTAYGSFLPKELYFPGLRAATLNGTGAGPIRDAQLLYQKAFAAEGVRPDLSDDLTWDPALIAIDTLRHIGPNGSGEAARAYISGLHSFFGINGLYDFRDGSHRGMGIGSIVEDRWDAAKKDFVAVSKPGGVPL